MIESITGTHVDDAYHEALWRIRVNRHNWPVEDTRNGKVIAAPHPVVTTFLHPTHRVLFDEERDANPFFHLMESVWMLLGRRDVDFVSQFAGQMKEYSDNDIYFNGAYGHRWRTHFGTDQVGDVIEMLNASPNTRRAVISMFDPKWDLGSDSKDIPCNTNIYFRGTLEGQLDMTVCNRSNDIVWGCYGANAVHMSVLLEHVAAYTDYQVGKMYVLSNNWHIYEQHWPLIDTVAREENLGYPISLPMFSVGRTQWLKEASRIVGKICPVYDGVEDPFLRKVLAPMRWAHYLHKSDKTEEAIEFLRDHMAPCDWKAACVNWLTRRLNRNK